MKIAESGKKQLIYYRPEINPDCSPAEPSSVKIIDQPINGIITIEKGTEFPNYESDSIFYHCNFEKRESTLVYYQSIDGFVGYDIVSMDFVDNVGDMVRKSFFVKVKM